MTARLTLSPSEIAFLAARHGFDPADADVTENAEQAIHYAGRDGKRGSWGATEDGVLCAFLLLDGYLAETARVMRCDAAADLRFEIAAFGDD